MTEGFRWFSLLNFHPVIFLIKLRCFNESLPFSVLDSTKESLLELNQSRSFDPAMGCGYKSSRGTWLQYLEERYDVKILLQSPCFFFCRTFCRWVETFIFTTMNHFGNERTTKQIDYDYPNWSFLEDHLSLSMLEFPSSVFPCFGTLCVLTLAHSMLLLTLCQSPQETVHS